MTHLKMVFHTHTLHTFPTVSLLPPAFHFTRAAFFLDHKWIISLFSRTLRSDPLFLIIKTLRYVKGYYASTRSMSFTAPGAMQDWREMHSEGPTLVSGVCGSGPVCPQHRVCTVCVEWRLHRRVRSVSLHLVLKDEQFLPFLLQSEVSVWSWWNDFPPFQNWQSSPSSSTSRLLRWLGSKVAGCCF